MDWEKDLELVNNSAGWDRGLAVCLPVPSPGAGEMENPQYTGDSEQRLYLTSECLGRLQTQQRSPVGLMESE